MNKPLALLGGITPEQFLAEYWQKKPLLIRNAVPNFKGLLTPNELAGLACEDDVQARIIKQSKGKWNVQASPFEEAIFAQLPKKDWTLLVQSVNHYLPEAADLLAQFNFIPHARLDDLMVSYAPSGGGVGAHVDSYDVFLLQGSGRRNWKISAQKDLSWVENVPLRILKNFVSEQDWTLEVGDMLYLPSQIAHWGVSQSDDCMTYSIGFRAPKTQELVHEFLNYLQDHMQDNISAESLYMDADLSLQNHPAEISETMINKVSQMLQTITWDDNIVADFLGRYLTEPKPDVVFDVPRNISFVTFKKQLSTKNVTLDLKSQMLFHHHHFYLNGEKLAVTTELMACMRDLADKRYINLVAWQFSIHAGLAETLYEPYSAGFIHLNE